ncbi:MAG: hypothetical protein EBX41_05900, partial [Chitinophagia bacterium]|nr:hypothetical protein [Chitinophagia bacterium]
MMFRALLLLLALLLSEAYTFILVKDIAKGLREPVQKSLVWGYVILTVLTWASFRVIRFSKNEFFSQASVKNTLIAWGMGVLLAKMLVAIFPAPIV